MNWIFYLTAGVLFTSLFRLYISKEKMPLWWYAVVIWSWPILLVAFTLGKDFDTKI